MQKTTVIRKLGAFSFDAVFSESHTHELEVTDNPIETGSVVSDHAFMLPIRLTLTAGVSDTPLAEINNDQFAGGQGRSVKAFDLITQLQRFAEPFDVQTKLRLYKNIICTKIDVFQDKENQFALDFTAELREVIIVNTRTVKYKSRKVKKTNNSDSKDVTTTDKHAKPKEGPTARQANPVVEKAEVKPTPVTDKARGSSWAIKLRKAVTGQ
jgi:hypothetical protein